MDAIIRNVSVEFPLFNISLFLVQSLDVEQYALLKSKISRQKVENDNVKLKNRIAMLEIEERKMMKKINDTRRRAD